MRIKRGRFLKFITGLSLRARMLFLYTLCTFVVIILIGDISYNTTVSILKEKEKNNLINSLYYVTNKLNSSLETINKRFLKTFSEPRFIELFRDFEEEDKNTLEIMANFNIEISEYFMDIISNNNNILKSIILFMHNEIYTDNFSKVYYSDDFLKSGFFRQAMEKKNKVLYINECGLAGISRSFYYDWSSTENIVGSEISDGTRYSVLAFFINRKFLQEIINDASKRMEAKVVILDGDGNVVVESDSNGMNTLAGIRYYDIMGDGILPNEEGTFYFKSNGKNFTANYNKIKIAGWNTVSIYDQSILYRDMGKIQDYVLGIMAASFFLVFLIANFISGSVVKPIKKLTRLMNRAKESNFYMSEEKFGMELKTRFKDEVADLCRTFFIMIKRINDLMKSIQEKEKQKREEEIRALQAQINPHFLYNTLDTIYWMAVSDDNDKIPDIIADLGSFFRLSLNNGEDITELENEIEHIKKYMSIQKVRYTDRFEYKIDIDKSLYGIRIPKLILQPIIENSLLHGFNNIGYKGMISISALIRNDLLVLRLEDNGKGFDMGEARKSASIHSSRSGKSSYALKNIDERIRLYYGSNYGISISSEKGKGTCVIIKLPACSEKTESDLYG